MNYLGRNLLRFSTYYFFIARSSLAEPTTNWFNLVHSIAFAFTEGQLCETNILEVIAKILIHVKVYIKLHYLFSCDLYSNFVRIRREANKQI